MSKPILTGLHRQKLACGNHEVTGNPITVTVEDERQAVFDAARYYVRTIRATHSVTGTAVESAREELFREVDTYENSLQGAEQMNWQQRTEAAEAELERVRQLYQKEHIKTLFSQVHMRETLETIVKTDTCALGQCKRLAEAAISTSAGRRPMRVATGSESPAISERTEMTVTIKDRQFEGSCNECQDRTTKAVLVVELQSVTFRLCQRCTDDLLVKLLVNIQPLSDAK